MMNLTVKIIMGVVAFATFLVGMLIIVKIPIRTIKRISKEDE